MTGIDFTSQDPDPMLNFAVDPACVADACYALYHDQFEKAGIDKDALEDMLAGEEIEAIRAEVTRQMTSFSSFWKILSTEMVGLLSGSTDLVQRAVDLKAAGLDPSGRSSSAPPSASGSR